MGQQWGLNTSGLHQKVRTLSLTAVISVTCSCCFTARLACVRVHFASWPLKNWPLAWDQLFIWLNLSPSSSKRVFRDAVFYIKSVNFSILFYFGGSTVFDHFCVHISNLFLMRKYSLTPNICQGKVINCKNDVQSWMYKSVIFQL